MTRDESLMLLFVWLSIFLIKNFGGTTGGRQARFKSIMMHGQRLCSQGKNESGTHQLAMYHGLTNFSKVLVQPKRKLYDWKCNVVSNYWNL